MNILDDCGFPEDHIDDALLSLCAALGVSPGTAARVRPVAQGSPEVLLHSSSCALGIECQPTTLNYESAREAVRYAAPALFQVKTDAGCCVYLALTRARGRRVSLATRAGRDLDLPASEFLELVTRDLRAQSSEAVERTLDSAGVSGQRRSALRARLEEQLLRGLQIEQVWLVQAHAGRAFSQTLLRSGLVERTFGLLLLHFIAFAAMIASWLALVRGGLGGSVDWGWLAAWALLTLSIAPARALEGWIRGEVTLSFAHLLRRRLMNGVLRVDMLELKRDGVGRALSRVIESQTFEEQALAGGLGLLTGGIELVILLSLLLALRLSPALCAIMGATCAALLFSCHRRSLWRAAWMEQRLQLSHDLLERMVGHRTRLAQLPAGHIDEDADRALSSYLHQGTEMDRWSVRLNALSSQGFPVLGVLSLVGLSPELSGMQLALGIGFVLLATQTLQRVAQGLNASTDARLAWSAIAAVFRAGREAAEPPTLGLVQSSSAPEATATLIRAQDLCFAYPSAPPLLERCSFEIRTSDRILLEGPSGSGKSTLAALLCGLLRPTSGLLLLRGFDLGSLGGSTWRSRVGAAPQIHQNHVFTGTLAFNLLMGRGWPPKPGELELARITCEQLGLGPLIDRMPSGMHQMLGESGWQLSHGERSRLFIARALLQDSDLLLLDESFGALDPTTLEQTMHFVLNQPRALIVIAHPSVA